MLRTPIRNLLMTECPNPQRGERFHHVSGNAFVRRPENGRLDEVSANSLILAYYLFTSFLKFFL